MECSKQWWAGKLGEVGQAESEGDSPPPRGRGEEELSKVIHSFILSSLFPSSLKLTL